MNSENHKYTNELIKQKSPYLLQHAHNPVNWFPWGNEALDKAKRENKLIIISIGYSACHWCHVMEKESFENEEIAKIMNDNFVSIKVDREERPDVDQIYMDSVQLISGSGGWPLNCIALPDSLPVFGGTYFKPNQWTDILTQLSERYKTSPEIFLQSAEQIASHIKSNDLFDIKNHEDFDFENIKLSTEKAKSYFDTEYGGTSGVRKFPMPTDLNFFLEYYFHTKDIEILEHIELTLKKMAYGGIFDQIGGGFSRYSVDPYWKVPHFEKMLYDNAQLISLYSKAYSLTNNNLYKEVVYKTFSFCERELLSENNGFYASLDADSEGEEGKFYVWNKLQIDEILKEDSDIFCRFFNVDKSGNWESDKNVLFRNLSESEFAIQNKISESQLSELIKKSSSKLFFERQKRVRPNLDNKIITSWNSLMITALTDAYKYFSDEIFLIQAVKTADFIIEKMLIDNSVLRVNNENIKINGFLDDYSFTTEAFIHLFESTGNEKYINLSKKLTDYTIEHFFDSKNQMFFYTSDFENSLFVRKPEIADNVTPSSNSVTAKNLLKLSVIFSENNKREIAYNMINNLSQNILNHILYHGNWASAMLKLTNKNYEVVVCGNNSLNFVNEISKNYRPDILFAPSLNNSSIPIFENRYIKNQTIIYVCNNNTCNLPVKSVNEAVKLIC
jgi:uncharacterized protein YyaL (SSP411 family)